MKKTLLISFIVLGFAGLSHSANLANVKSKTRIEQMPSFPSYSTFMSTMVNVAVTSQTVVISSVPAILHTFVINKADGLDAKVEIFNAKITTSSPNSELLFSVLGSTAQYSPSSWDIYCDSGVAVNVTGSILPNVTVIYRQR